MKRGFSETCYTFLMTLANPTRLAILELLSEGSKSVTEIAKTLNQEQSMVSHNLKRLSDCSFVFSEKRKQERYYSLNGETLSPIFKTFAHHLEKYCPGGDRCLTRKNLRTERKREASNRMYVTH